MTERHAETLTNNSTNSNSLITASVTANTIPNPNAMEVDSIQLKINNINRQLSNMNRTFNNNNNNNRNNNNNGFRNNNNGNPPPLTPRRTSSNNNGRQGRWVFQVTVGDPAESGKASDDQA
ncbi:hypothetical protein BGZ96_001934 [Linnemannia gamsii]|uniref:Uncharacterized protein n=1 Tax=Linnemannia gamsii TaxID=64522 RepID=A0ABQ7JLK2_9FUNG|nr:hypothetical protein BGZ96_001934 [Linnemannia gamsii]